MMIDDVLGTKAQRHGGSTHLILQCLYTDSQTGHKHYASLTANDVAKLPYLWLDRFAQDTLYFYF
jgi:hypothetical protein